MKNLYTLLILLGLSTSTIAQDWPMWRYDAGRGASTPHALPADLHLQWTLQLEASMPAWDHTQPKLHFDLATQPVVMDGRLFVPSSRHEGLSAYDTQTGKALWHFDANGPVRFAPVAWQDRVYFVSDDGYLYCLNAQTGALDWKRNGGPKERWVIGNHRLVSSWPARGGPVLKDGVIYFSASIWPFMGIFIHAIDAKTGDTVWTNSGDGNNYIVHPHGAPAFGSVVPQGHLAVSGDALIVSGGRSAPAVYELKTGALRHFIYDKRRGDHIVMAGPDAYYNASTAMDLKNGSVLGSEMPVTIDAQAIIFRHGSKLTARAPKATWESQTKKDKRGKTTTTRKLKQDTLFEQSLEDAGHIFLRAGTRVYSGALDQIAAHELKGDAKPVWQDKIEGEVWSMLAGDERLFVITKSNRIYCYGKMAGEAVHHHPPSQAFKSAKEDWQNYVQRLLTQPGAADGHTVILGAGSGQLMLGLLEESKASLTVVEGNPSRAGLLRKILKANGVYGERISVRNADPDQAPLPPYMANLVVSETADLSDNWIRTAWKTLRPYGGMAAIPCDEATHKALAARIGQLPFANAELKRLEGITYLVRAGALPNTDDWTHQYGNPAQTVTSQDEQVKPPFGVLWFGGPPHDGVLPRHGHGPSPQVAAGRLVIEGADMLRAVDVYTGRLLWQRELKDFGKYYNRTDHFAGAGEIGSNYVTLPDAVYAVYGPRILELDPATGLERRAFTLEQKTTTDTPDWGFLAVSGDYLVATSSPVPVDSKAAPKASKKPALAKNTKPVIPQGSEWRYLAGSDPAAEWNQLHFDDKPWKSGKAGFGYGDNDDQTTLNMKGKFKRVYIRKSFTRSQLGGGRELTLAINYDDAFIAYLNGKEITRKHVSGRGADAKVTNHEADGFDAIPLANAYALLKDGPNVLAIEGHNISSTSSDFTLDPFLVVKAGAVAASAKPEPAPASDPLPKGQYAPGSRRLLVFNRKTGKKLWERDAVYNWRHNNIALSGDRLFCIDHMTDPRLDALKRRGIEIKGQAAVYAFDLATGDVMWKNDEQVFGTFLNYSAEHDLLIQAGSSNRDRARDESQVGIAAFHGSSGDIAWKDPGLKYGGPLLLRKDEIITNGNGGYAIDIRTGSTRGWSYKRQYGCNSVIGSTHILTFRSGAAGFYDMQSHAGTSNIGGLRSSCTSNLIPANGVLNLPDYTRTCSCAYQNQTSLALVHMPEGEYWSFSGQADQKHIGLNFGSPGDRTDSQGTLWYDWPSTGGDAPSAQLKVQLSPAQPERYRSHQSQVISGEPAWVAGSGLIGLEDMRIEAEAGSDWKIHLHFLEPEQTMPGERVFDVAVNGQVVLKDFDIVKEAGASWTGLVKELRARANGSSEIRVAFKAKAGKPVIAGIELQRL